MRVERGCVRVGYAVHTCSGCLTYYSSNHDTRASHYVRVAHCAHAVYTAHYGTATPYIPSGVTYIFIQMALSPLKAWALQQCFLTPPVVADSPERLRYPQQNCAQ